MTTTQLSCFRCLVEEGSVTRAARRLCVTQPAVSQQLRLLEEDLGCELYRQHGRHIELTPDGEYLYERAKRILSELDRLPDGVRSRGKQAIGRVRIGSGQVAAKTVIRDTIHDILQQYPDISFSLFETNSSSLPELIRKSRIDLGVGIVVTRHKGIHFEQLLTGRLLLICSEHNPSWVAD